MPFRKFDQYSALKHALLLAVFYVVYFSIYFVFLYFLKYTVNFLFFVRNDLDKYIILQPPLTSFTVKVALAHSFQLYTISVVLVLLILM